MTHPHSTEIAKVAEVFEWLARRHPEGVVDMDMMDIIRRNDDEHCVACMAGWYTLGTLVNPTDITWDSVSESDIARRLSDVRAYARWTGSDTDRDISYTHGADSIAGRFGFHTFEDVETFFKCRPWVWGTSNGEMLFSDATAFGRHFDDTLTLNDLANHWRGVEARMRQIEEEMQRSGRSFDEVEMEFQTSEAESA